MVINRKTTGDFIEGGVRSSNILRVLYNKKTLMLYIFFMNKKVYSYVPVSESLFNELLLAVSVGKFFVQRIKGNPELMWRKEFSITDFEKETFLKELE